MDRGQIPEKCVREPQGMRVLEELKQAVDRAAVVKENLYSKLQAVARPLAPTPQLEKNKESEALPAYFYEVQAQVNLLHAILTDLENLRERVEL